MGNAASALVGGISNAASALVGGIGNAANSDAEILSPAPEIRARNISQGMIERFPRHLRGMGGTGRDDERYVVPSVVAIGPYHHGLPHLQPMEGIKREVTKQFCEQSRRSEQDVYNSILSEAERVRLCYGDVSVVAHTRLTDDEIALMMLVDGCFLLSYLDKTNKDPLVERCRLSSGPSIEKDIFMLENQIPWLVLTAIIRTCMPPITSTDVMNTDVMNKVRTSVASMGVQIFARKKVGRGGGGGGGGDDNNTTSTLHLLDLLRSTLIRTSNNPPTTGGNKSSLLSRSVGAVELAQKGIKITASKKEWFAHMECQKNLFFGELSLSPLSLDDVGACWLVNMAALESTGAYNDNVSSSINARSPNNRQSSEDGDVVSSYLFMLSMLMDKEGDVHKIRSRGVLRSNFSNKQTLDFFKSLGQHLRPGDNYTATLGQIQDYIHSRPVRNKVHKFFYKHFKLIAAILSIAGVIATILKALYTAKQH